MARPVVDIDDIKGVVSVELDAIINQSVGQIITEMNECSTGPHVMVNGRIIHSCKWRRLAWP